MINHLREVPEDDWSLPVAHEHVISSRYLSLTFIWKLLLNASVTCNLLLEPTDTHDGQRADDQLGGKNHCGRSKPFSIASFLQRSQLQSSQPDEPRYEHDP